MSNKYKTIINSPTLTFFWKGYLTNDWTECIQHSALIKIKWTKRWKQNKRKKITMKNWNCFEFNACTREINWRDEIPILSVTNVLMGPFNVQHTSIVLSTSTCLCQACGCFKLHTIHNNNTFVTFAIGMLISFCSTFRCFGQIWSSDDSTALVPNLNIGYCDPNNKSYSFHVLFFKFMNQKNWFVLVTRICVWRCNINIETNLFI